MDLNDAMNYVELALQFPFCICILLGSVILIDISRAVGLFRINKADRCVAEVLRNNPNMRKIVLHDALNAILTEICIIAVLSSLMLDSSNKLLIVVIGILGLILIHFMISLYCTASFAAENKDELLSE